MDYDTDINLEPVADAIRTLANALTPTGAVAGHDASGGYVRSVTEAVMGITSGLYAIASSIERLGDAVQDLGTDVRGALNRDE